MSAEALKWLDRQQIVSRKFSNILNVLAIRANKEGKTWISQQTIADRMRVSPFHVRELLKQLELLGIITRQRRSTRKGRLTDIIVLSLDQEFDLGKEAIKASLAAAKEASATATFLTLAKSPATATRVARNKHPLPSKEESQEAPSQEGTYTDQDRARGRRGSRNGQASSNVIPLVRRSA